MIGWVTGAEASTSDELLSVKEVEVLSIDHMEGNRYRLTVAEYYDDAYATDMVISTLPGLESGISVDNLVGKTSFTIIGHTQTDRIVLTWTGNAELYYIFITVFTTMRRHRGLDGAISALPMEHH